MKIDLARIAAVVAATPTGVPGGGGDTMLTAEYIHLRDGEEPGHLRFHLKGELPEGPFDGIAVLEEGGSSWEGPEPFPYDDDVLEGLLDRFDEKVLNDPEIIAVARKEHGAKWPFDDTYLPTVASRVATSPTGVPGGGGDEVDKDGVKYGLTITPGNVATLTGELNGKSATKSRKVNYQNPEHPDSAADFRRSKHYKGLQHEVREELGLPGGYYSVPT